MGKVFVFVAGKPGMVGLVAIELFSASEISVSYFGRLLKHFATVIMLAIPLLNYQQYRVFFVSGLFLFVKKGLFVCKMFLIIQKFDESY